MRDTAFRWLTLSIERGFINYPFLSRHDPLLAPMREDPRFRQLMEVARERWERFEVGLRRGKTSVTQSGAQNVATVTSANAETNIANNSVTSDRRRRRDSGAVTTHPAAVSVHRDGCRCAEVLMTRRRELALESRARGRFL